MNNKMKKKEKLVVVVGRYISEEYIDFIKNLGEIEVIKFDDFTSDSGFREHGVDIVLYTGGADVNPDLYTEKLGKYTSIDKKRDQYETDMFKYTRVYQPLHVGICRGSQFLTVMSGGSLIQHVNNHTDNHEIVTNDGRRAIATSTHHQMMNPFFLPANKYEVLAWSKYYQATTYLNGRNEEISLPDEFLESEIVYYPATRSLAIQGHPEFASAEKPFKDICLSLIEEYLLKNR